MRIGYSSYNQELDLTTARAYRLNAYSDHRMAKTLDLNLGSLFDILQYNAQRGLRLFRLSPGFIPFAGSTVIQLDWVNAFSAHLQTAGNLVRQGDHRLYVFIPNLLINSPRQTVVDSSTAELTAYADLLDGMSLDTTHRIGISIGGVFGDKKKSIKRFVTNFNALPPHVQARLALINDRDYSVGNCLAVSGETGLPVAFDTYWHRVNTGGEAFLRQFELAQRTWTASAGAPIVTYLPDFGISPRTKDPQAETVYAGDFLSFYQQACGFPFDLLVETKGYEKGALRALDLTNRYQQAS